MHKLDENKQKQNETKQKKEKILIIQIATITHHTHWLVGGCSRGIHARDLKYFCCGSVSSSY